MDDAVWMEYAIRTAAEGIAAGQTPFGACIVQAGRVVACAHNTVWADTDITAHAEINAIRAACAALGTIDLSGCVIYSTCEPCPMCFTACHWARLDRIVYGASIADAAAAGFHELPIADATLQHLGNSPVILEAGVLREACVQLFTDWREGGGRAY